jgi:hypothetical protein
MALLGEPATPHVSRNIVVRRSRWEAIQAFYSLKGAGYPVPQARLRSGGSDGSEGFNRCGEGADHRITAG